MDARVLIAGGVILLAAIAVGTIFLLKPKPAPPPPVKPVRVKPQNPEENPIARAQALFEQGKVDDALALLSTIADSDPQHAEALARIEKYKSTAPPTNAAPAPSDATLDELRISGLAAAKSSRFIDAVKALDSVVKARPDDVEAADALTKSRERVGAMGNAVKAYNEQDYQSSIKLLWTLRKQDAKNQDVEEFLFKSYLNDGIQGLQSGNIQRAAQSMQEALQLRPNDVEAQRHLKFARKYPKGQPDLLSRIYVSHLTARP
jgi:tetratricopeptide (TPR) repeat protein